MKNPVKLSVVVTAYNESEKLARCLSSVRALADEIIVVDSSSTDNTREVAKRFTTHIFRQPNDPMLNKNKNFGFSKATGEWILCLDSDEVIPTELADEIKQITHFSSALVRPAVIVGYWIPRKNIIFGKWITHGLWWPDKQLRLILRGRGIYPCKHVHEYVAVDGLTKDLTNAYIHYNYETISQYLWKMEHIYTVNEVENLINTGYQLSWYDAIRFPVSDFIKIYFAQEGYKDGLHGLVLSLLQSIYSFLVFAKLWEKQKFKQYNLSFSEVSNEIYRSGKEVRYWILTSKLKSTPAIIYKILYKLLRRMY